MICPHNPLVPPTSPITFYYLPVGLLYTLTTEASLTKLNRDSMKPMLCFYPDVKGANIRQAPIECRYLRSLKASSCLP